MTTFEQKKEAFDAYQKSNITNDQLRVMRQSVDDLLSTMRAMGEHGYHLQGYYLLAHSLESMQNARNLK